MKLISFGRILHYWVSSDFGSHIPIEELILRVTVVQHLYHHFLSTSLQTMKQMDQNKT